MMLANGVADKRRPRTRMPNNTNNFLFIENLFNRTTINKKAETEQLTLKFLNCQMRKRRPLDWRVELSRKAAVTSLRVVLCL